MSIAALYQLEQLQFALQMMCFDESRHLKEREKPYPEINRSIHGIFIIRETAEGWWRESIDFKGDVKKQVAKLKADPSVAAAWLNRPRFYEPGGWYDPC